MNFDQVRQDLDYDRSSGLFRWKASGRGRLLNKPAGNITSNGYVHVCVCGKRYAAHRLAWFLTYGEWPIGHIDHVNRNKADNRISNLRLSEAWQNQQNKKAPSSNRSGLKGIRFKKNRWEVSCMVRGTREYLGRYSTKEEAVEAYNSFASRAVGEFFVAADIT